MAAGRPVIAYGVGGAVDTVIPGETGLHFGEPTAESLIAAVRQFDASLFDPGAIRRHAEKFDKSAFEGKLRAYVERMAGL
jgi:glycosyltransferase involved in cell wall biosynthesis